MIHKILKAYTMFMIGGLLGLLLRLAAGKPVDIIVFWIHCIIVAVMLSLNEKFRFYIRVTWRALQGKI